MLKGEPTTSFSIFMKSGSTGFVIIDLQLMLTYKQLSRCSGIDKML